MAPPRDSVRAAERDRDQRVALHYQPKVDIRSDRAVADCGRWNAEGLDLGVAVNLSALDLFDNKLPAYISGLLSEAGLSPSKLVLELTESAVMRDPAHALKILEELKRLGVSLAIDDYGTGYSSLSHLKRVPVDELKIDKSFVMNLGRTSMEDILIIRSTIDLGHNMGLKVIAEGVEDAEGRFRSGMGGSHGMPCSLPSYNLSKEPSHADLDDDEQRPDDRPERSA